MVWASFLLNYNFWGKKWNKHENIDGNNISITSVFLFFVISLKCEFTLLQEDRDLPSWKLEQATDHSATNEFWNYYNIFHNWIIMLAFRMGRYYINIVLSSLHYRNGVSAVF